MSVKEENVVHAEERFQASRILPLDPEIQRKESLGFSFAIGKRPDIHNQTKGNVVDITDYECVSNPLRQMGQATLEVVKLSIQHDDVEIEKTYTDVSTPITSDITRLGITFPREAELMHEQLKERAKRGDTNQQLLTQLAFYTYGMQQSQELHTPDLHPYLHAAPDSNE
jgi:hypothetical protein